MQRRGHRAYQHVDMADVRVRAQELPDDDMPPELIRLLPVKNDSSLDKILSNKNATLVVGGKSLEEMAKDLDNSRFDAVVCERSSVDERDKIAQNRSCLEHTVRKLKGLVGPG